MVHTLQDINKFCKYFRNYSQDYANITGGNIGGFKSHNKDTYEALKSQDAELSHTNICEFIFNAFNKITIDPEDITTATFLFLTDIKTKGIDQKYGTSKFNETQFNFLGSLLDSTTSGFNSLSISNPFTNQVITDTLPGINEEESHHPTPSDSQTLDDLIHLYSTQTKDTSSLFTDLFTKLETSLITKIESVVHKQVTDEMVKHLGINKNLTTSEVDQVCNKLGYTFRSILKKEHQILLLTTHNENGTTPEELKHKKFPAPFMAFNHKPLFIDKYNKIIETAQKSNIELEINEFKADISSLNNDVRVHCNILKHHVQDLEAMKTEIHDFQQRHLKSNFDSSSTKVSKAVKEAYSIARKSRSEQKSNKQFTNSNKDSSNAFNSTAAAKPNHYRSKSTDKSNTRISKSNSNRNVNFSKNSNISRNSNINFNSLPLLNTYPNNSNFISNNENFTSNQTPLPQRNNNNSNQFFHQRSTNRSKN